MSAAASPVTPPSARGWREACLALAAVLLWILAWYRQTATAMVAIWERSDTYTHGFVIPPLVLWLVWRQRHALRQIAPRPSGWLWLLMAAPAAAWLLGDLASVNALTQLCLVSLLVLAVPAVLGGAVARALAFPLAFAFFAVPFGDFMMPKLMEWTADFTVLALRASGIPVYREGLQFVIPSGNWSVVEACSGVRYLIASVMVGCLFAYLNYRSMRRRLVFIVVSFLVPIAANWLRAYIIVMLGHLSGNKIAAGVDHLIYGWVFFGVVIMVMFMIGARWADAPPAPGAGDVVVGTGFPAPSSLGRLGAVVAAVFLVSLAPHAAHWLIDRGQNTAAPVIADFAPQPGWTLMAQPPVQWVPAFDNPSATRSFGFVGSDQSTVGVFVGYYRQQDYQRKLVSSENVLVKSKDPHWAVVGQGTRSVDLGGRPLVVRTADLRAVGLPERPGDSRWTAWRFYWVDGKLTASDPLAKLYGALGRLAGKGDDGADVVLYAPREGGDARLESFLQTHAEQLRALLEQTRLRQ